MFERYTERGRRAIFFARYEASQFGTPEITSAQLLLGILREDKRIALQLGVGTLESIRKELEPLKGTPTATSIDLPVSRELARALAYAAEEAERLNHKHIHTPHLVLGLMRVRRRSAGAVAAQTRSRVGEVSDVYRASRFSKNGLQ